MYKLISSNSTVLSTDHGNMFSCDNVQDESFFVATDSRGIGIKSNDYINLLSSWKDKIKFCPNGEEELRSQAVCKIKECIKLNKEELDLSGLNLTSLPESLPDHITRLIINRNKLTVLPENTPKKIKEIHASHNRIETFPLIIPRDIDLLDLSYNCLIFIPDMYREMKSSSKLDITGNPITTRNVAEFNPYNLNAPSDYNGANIIYPEETKDRHASILKLAREIFKDPDRVSRFPNLKTADKCFDDFKKMEENINKEKREIFLYNKFVNFIACFYSAIKTCDDVSLKENIKRILTGSALNKKTRKEIFDIADDTMADCNQKLISGYSQMMIVIYGEDIDLFGDDCYGIFKLNMEKVKRLKAVEDLMSSRGIYNKNNTYIINKINIYFYLCNELLGYNYTQSEFIKHKIKDSLKDINYIKCLFSEQQKVTEIESKFKLMGYNCLLKYAKKKKYINVETLKKIELDKTGRGIKKDKYNDNKSYSIDKESDETKNIINNFQLSERDYNNLCRYNELLELVEKKEKMEKGEPVYKRLKT